jgi:hypothetical protein
MKPPKDKLEHQSLIVERRTWRRLPATDPSRLRPAGGAGCFVAFFRARRLIAAQWTTAAERAIRHVFSTEVLHTCAQNV